MTTKLAWQQMYYGNKGFASKTHKKLIVINIATKSVMTTLQPWQQSGNKHLGQQKIFHGNKKS